MCAASQSPLRCSTRVSVCDQRAHPIRIMFAAAIMAAAATVVVVALPTKTALTALPIARDPVVFVALDAAREDDTSVARHRRLIPGYACTYERDVDYSGNDVTSGTPCQDYETCAQLGLTSITLGAPLRVRAHEGDDGDSPSQQGTQDTQDASFVCSRSDNCILTCWTSPSSPCTHATAHATQRGCI